MTEDLGLSLNEINAQNIAVLGSEQSLLEERRIIELREAVDEVITRVVNLYGDITALDIIAIVSSCHLHREDYIHVDALEENFHRLRSYLSTINEFDQFIFTELILEKLFALGFVVSEKDFLSQNNHFNNVIFVKNSLSDEAYDVFCQDFSELKAAYVDNMKELSRELLENAADCAILPIEGKGGVRIGVTMDLIHSRDLKINAITPTFGLDGLADTKYALISRFLSVPNVLSGDDLYFELRIPKSESIAKIFSAAEYFGYAVYSINSISINSFDNHDSFYTIVFKSENGSFLKLISYFTLFIASYTPVGLYKNLE